MAFGENPTPVDNNTETNTTNVENNEKIDTNKQNYLKAKNLAEKMNIFQGKLQIKEKTENGSKGERMYVNIDNTSHLSFGGPESYGSDITFNISKYNEETKESTKVNIKILGTGEIEINGKTIADNLKEKVLNKIESEMNELIEKQAELKKQEAEKLKQEQKKQEAEEIAKTEKEMNDLMNM